MRFKQAIAIVSPLWAPLSTGFVYYLYGKIFTRPSKNLVEGSVTIIGAISYIIGLIIFLNMENTPILVRHFWLAVYIVVGSFVLFFSGWSGMILGGYGY